MGYEEFYLVIVDECGNVQFYWGNCRGELSAPHWCNMCIDGSYLRRGVHVWGFPEIAERAKERIVGRTIVPNGCKAEIRSFRY